MSHDKKHNAEIEKLVQEIVSTYEGDSGTNFIDVSDLPRRDKILKILDLFTEVLFPGYTGKKEVTRKNISSVLADILADIHSGLVKQTERAYLHACRIKKCEGCDCKQMAEDVTAHLFSQLSKIRGLLKTDVAAAYDGDPAARSFEEVVISYPCIMAISTHRIAHELYLKDVPLIPRIMSECAHRRTGIDIHPGAKIGKNFFIDHGTGVVIGETAIIGNNVRMYHGVTLGALRFETDADGSLLKGGKRHPTVEDDVVICPEATLLGDITIGKGALVGSNTWVSQDVPPGITIKMSNPELVSKKRKNHESKD